MGSKIAIKDGLVVITILHRDKSYAGNAKVDIEDIEIVKGKRWCFVAHGYVGRRGDNGFEYLHRAIMQPPDGCFVDHINHDRSDNRRSNLRIATAQENSRNLRPRSRNSSGVVGVSWLRRDKRWYASICVDYKTINLGQYKEVKHAIESRKAAEKKYFGEFAPSNSLML